MTDIISQDIIFIEHALKLAKKASSLREVPVGAIVVIDKKIVGEGFNCPIMTSDPTAHAEIIALRKAAEFVGNYRLSGATLYVTLEPCTMCVGAMLHARIDRLVYGANDPKTGAVQSVFKILDDKSLNHRIDFCGGVLASECGQILSGFFQSKR
jgi:tRNA(adenine34) deaminase